MPTPLRTRIKDEIKRRLELIDGLSAPQKSDSRGNRLDHLTPLIFTGPSAEPVDFGSMGNCVVESALPIGIMLPIFQDEDDTIETDERIDEWLAKLEVGLIGDFATDSHFREYPTGSGDGNAIGRQIYVTARDWSDQTENQPGIAVILTLIVEYAHPEGDPYTPR